MRWVTHHLASQDIINSRISFLRQGRNKREPTPHAACVCIVVSALVVSAKEMVDEAVSEAASSG